MIVLTASCCHYNFYQTNRTMLFQVDV